ncbi:MAG: hypothetical protein M3R08_00630, partial [Bacteroidota bacterium]|nr:hypothetical protein [Bacteroidota bacterium]
MAAENVDRLFLRCDHDTTAYARLQGLIWASNGLAYPELLQERCVAAIAETVRTCSAIHFILNCEGVTDMDDHAFDQLFKGNHMKGKSLRLINADHLRPRLAPYLEVKSDFQSLEFRHNEIALGENVPNNSI